MVEIKKPFYHCVLSVIAMIFIMMLIAITPGQAKTILTMNHQFPSTAAGSKIDQWFADQVEKASNGNVMIRIFWSNGLGKARDNLDMLSKGNIDMAAMSAGYFPQKLPFFSEPNSIPMGLDNVCQSSALMKAFMTKIPAFKEEAAKHKIRPLFFHLLNPYLLTTKKPVTRFEDLKGLRIRTWGDDLPRLIKAAGATSVKLFLPDIYEALKRNVIDGCPFSVDLMVSYKTYDFARNVTQVVIWEGPSWGIWMNENAWQSLTPQYQKIILDSAQKATEKEIPKTLAAERLAIQFLAKQKVIFHPFAKAELAKWTAASPDFFKDFIHDMTQMGKAEAAQNTIKIWKQIRKQYRTCP